MAGNKGRSNNTNRLKSQKTENMSVKDSNSNKENKETISEVKSNNSVKSGNTNDKTQSKSDKKVTGFEVFKWIVGTIISVCTLFIAITNYTFNNFNAPLIIKCEDAEYKEETKTVEIKFHREQGNIAKAFQVDISDSGEYIFNQVSFSSKSNTFYVNLDASDNDSSSVDNENVSGYLNAEDIFCPAMKSFALALFDYKDNLYIYYVAVRACPEKRGGYYVNFLLYEDGTNKLVDDQNVDAKKVSKWKTNVVFLDCTFINSDSIENAMIEKFNNDEEGSTFEYDRDAGIYVSHFSLFEKGQTITWSIGETDYLNANIRVEHQDIDLNRDVELIKDLPNELLGKED